MNNCQQIVECYICPCNNRNYSNKQGLKSHNKTKLHQNWELNKNKKSNEIDITRFQNEIEHLKRLNKLLMDRIIELEK